jgi:hypothetical protein
LLWEIEPPNQSLFGSLAIHPGLCRRMNRKQLHYGY